MLDTYQSRREFAFTGTLTESRFLCLNSSCPTEFSQDNTLVNHRPLFPTMDCKAKQCVSSMLSRLSLYSVASGVGGIVWVRH